MVRVQPILIQLMVDFSTRCPVPHFSYRRWNRRNVGVLISLSYQQLLFTSFIRNTDCDYSSAYVALLTDSDLVGYGMTFTIGRGNEIVGPIISEILPRLLNPTGVRRYPRGC